MLCWNSGAVNANIAENQCLPADTFIQKTKKLYMDTRTQRNIAKLNADIAEVGLRALHCLCSRSNPM